MLKMRITHDSPLKHTGDLSEFFISNLISTTCVNVGLHVCPSAHARASRTDCRPTCLRKRIQFCLSLIRTGLVTPDLSSSLLRLQEQRERS